MQIKSVCLRYLTFLVGLTFTALGVSMITLPGMGSSPVSCLSLVLSIFLPFSFGTFVFIINAAMFVAELILYGKAFQPIQWLQLPATLIFGMVIDLSTMLLKLIPLPNYPARFMMMLCGCVMLGLGVAFEVIPDVIILPGEGIVKAIAFVSRKEFGLVKTIFDISMVSSALLLSFLVMGKLQGVREGTIVSALIVGSISRFFLARLTPPLKKLYHTSPSASA